MHVLLESRPGVELGVGGSFVHCQTELWSRTLAGDCGRSHEGLALRSPSPQWHTWLAHLAGSWVQPCPRHVGGTLSLRSRLNRLQRLGVPCRVGLVWGTVVLSEAPRWSWSTAFCCKGLELVPPRPGGEW